MRDGLPVVAIVGRPNVGKSTLFNRIVKKRIAIVDETPGVTRDRKYYKILWNKKEFYLVDTGGLLPKSEDIFQKSIDTHVEYAIQEAEVILFLVDGETGLVDIDMDVAGILQRYKDTKQIIVVVNKLDYYEDHTPIYEFYRLGFDEVFPISALHGYGVGDLLDKVVNALDRINILEDKKEEIKTINVAIVGKPNVGKSSLLNKLTREDFAIVSDIPGTTRDPIDTIVKFDDIYYKFIDTAGIRKKKKIQDHIEFYSVVRTERMITRSDVILLVLDASRELSNQDEEVVKRIQDSEKAIVGVVNKWDLVEKSTYTVEIYKEIFYSKFPSLKYVPLVFVSAKTGQRVNKIFKYINEVYNWWKYFIEDQQELQRYFKEEILEKHQHKSVRNKNIYFRKIEQVDVSPPTFHVYVNFPNLVKDEYKRYIANKIRNKYIFTGTPLKFIYKKSKVYTQDVIKVLY